MPALSLCLLLCCAPGSPAPTAQAHAPRAVWTWEEESFRMLDDPRFLRGAVEFLGSRQVGVVYLYADQFRGRNALLEEPGKYRALLAALHRRGFQVYALLGSIYLKTQEYVLPEKRGTALRMLQRVLDYQAAAPLESRFDGVNLDLEPHLLPTWGRKREELGVLYLDLGAALMAAKRKAGADLPVGPAIPFWWDQIAVEWRGSVKPLSEHVQDVYDYVALMDYRDHARGPDGILAHAEDELRYAERVARRVWIGVDTGPGEPAKVSFRHTDEAALERELGLVERDLAGRASFGGFVIHHFRTYREWALMPRAGKR